MIGRAPRERGERRPKPRSDWSSRWSPRPPRAGFETAGGPHVATIIRPLCRPRPRLLPPAVNGNRLPLRRHHGASRRDPATPTRGRAARPRRSAIPCRGATRLPDAEPVVVGLAARRPEKGCAADQTRAPSSNPFELTCRAPHAAAGKGRAAVHLTVAIATTCAPGSRPRRPGRDALRGDRVLIAINVIFLLPSPCQDCRS